MLRTMGPPQRQYRERKKAEHRHRRVLGETVHLEMWEEGHHRRAARLQLSDPGGQRRRSVDDVGLDEQQQLAASTTSSLLERPRFSQPRRRRLFSVDDTKPRVADRTYDRS